MKRKGGHKRHRKSHINDLKQELHIDHHIIPIDELFMRFGTNPENVSKFYKFSKIIIWLSKVYQFDIKIFDFSGFNSFKS